MAEAAAAAASSSRQNAPPTLAGDSTDATPSPPRDTPYAHKLSGTCPYVSDDSRNLAMVEEGTGHFIGPVSVRIFFQHVPQRGGNFVLDYIKLTQSEATHFKDQITQDAEHGETKMYATLWEMMARFEDYGNEFKIVDSSNKIILRFCNGGIKPDFVVHKDVFKKDGTYQLQNIELMIEIKNNEAHDPFDDDDDGQFESATGYGQKCRGQITAYAACHMSMQARTHIFQVLIIRDYARLLRWDRSGAIVTRKIPLDDPSFFEFLWRFYYLTPEERGWDMSVGNVDNQEEMDAARQALAAAEADLEMPEDEFPADYSKIRLGDNHYIVHRLFSSATQSPFGRGTRGYAAYSLTERKVVFLKSTWRIVEDGRLPEHEIYAILSEAGVQHIPTVLAYGDIDGHTTKTQNVLEGRGRGVKPLRTLQHYLIIFNEFCRQLATFKSTKELLGVFADAADGHQQAIEKANILHRDISAGNILITNEGKGLLSDWDLAKRLNDKGKHRENLQATLQPEHERTGTFQFMAARFVSDDDYEFGAHDRLDDVESFFHCLQWIVLRFSSSHGMSPKSLGNELHKTFDLVIPGENGPICPGRLLALYKSIWQKAVRSNKFTGILPGLLERLRETIQSRYRAFDDSLMHGKGSNLSQQSPLGTLQEPNWLRDCLREAATDPACPTTDSSEHQAYESVWAKSTAKLAISEKYVRVSAPEYYQAPSTPPSPSGVGRKLRPRKKQKVQNIPTRGAPGPSRGSKHKRRAPVKRV